METPDEMSVPRVRVNRDTADLRSKSPSTGAFSIILSRKRCPPSVAYHFLRSHTKAKPPPPRAHQNFCKKSLIPITIFVGIGSSIFTWANITWKVGMTNINRMTIAIPATEKITAG